MQAIHNADRERRLKQQKAASQQGGSGSELNLDVEKSDEEMREETGEGNEKKKRKRKREKQSSPTDPLTDLMPGFDPSFAAQMMQQFFALEKQMKETATQAVHPNMFTASAEPISAPPPTVPPPVNMAAIQRESSRISLSPLSYSSPNHPPTSTGLFNAQNKEKAKQGGVGPFPSLSLKTNTLAKTANFAFTTQKLKDVVVSKPPPQQKPAYTPKSAARDPLQAAKAVAQTVNIAMELRGAEQISDDEEEDTSQSPMMAEGELEGENEEDGDDLKREIVSAIHFASSSPNVYQ